MPANDRHIVVLEIDGEPMGATICDSEHEAQVLANEMLDLAEEAGADSDYFGGAIYPNVKRKTLLAWLKEEL